MPSAFFVAKARFRHTLSIVFTKTQRSSAKHLSRQASPLSALVPWVIPPQGQNLAEPQEIFGIFLQPVKGPLNGCTTFIYQPLISVVLSPNLRKVHSVPSFRSLMKMLNITRPSVYLQGAPVAANLQLDFKPCITTLRAQQFSQISIHLTIYLAYMSSVCQWGCYRRQC